MVWAVGSGLIVSMDDRGRVLIPKEIRRKVKTKLFTVELIEGSIVLKPLTSEILELAGKFKDLLEHRSMDELEEIQEEFLRKTGRI